MVGKKMLIGELTQGRELAAQLNQLDPVESREACQALVEKIVSTYDKALSMLNLRGLKREADQVETFHQTTAGHTNQVLTKDQDFQKDVSKKRKTVPKWNEQTSVSVCSGDGGEESPKEDGHRWRKYGQKDILGAKFPRAYYRCTHRKTHGCMATKKIQRSDYDSSVFQIIYKGLHTCVHHLNLSTSSSIDIPITNKISKLNTDRATPSEALRNLQQGLKVETEKMNHKEEIFDFSSVSFTPFTQSAENVESELFMNLLKEDPDQVDYSSPLFLSPTTTSGSDFIQFDWRQVNDFGLSGAGGVLQSSESEITATDMNLTPTSAFESPFIDLDFCVDQIENFDTTTFLNESLGYFS